MGRSCMYMPALLPLCENGVMWVGKEEGNQSNVECRLASSGRAHSSSALSSLPSLLLTSIILKWLRETRMSTLSASDIFAAGIKAELARDYGTAFTSYVAAAQAFLALARGAAEAQTREKAKTNAAKAMQRAEKVKGKREVGRQTWSLDQGESSGEGRGGERLIRRPCSRAI